MDFGSSFSVIDFHSSRVFSASGDGLWQRVFTWGGADPAGATWSPGLLPAAARENEERTPGALVPGSDGTRFFFGKGALVLRAGTGEPGFSWVPFPFEVASAAPRFSEKEGRRFSLLEKSAAATRRLLHGVVEPKGLRRVHVERIQGPSGVSWGHAGGTAFAFTREGLWRLTAKASYRTSLAGRPEVLLDSIGHAFVKISEGDACRWLHTSQHPVNTESFPESGLEAQCTDSPEPFAYTDEAHFLTRGKDGVTLNSIRR